MSKTVLVTGGAGFIGSHIVDRYLEKGYEVKVFDSFEQQVHNGEIPEHLNEDAEYIVGDMRDKEALKEALEGVDIVSHQASWVGVGQSMYEIAGYTDANVLGTANLWDIIVNEDDIEIEKVVVASSMSNYGEGKYSCEEHGVVYPDLRSEEQMDRGEWEQKCPECGETVEPVPTDEEKPLEPNSVYAMTKRDQEEMSLLLGKTYGVDVVCLRYFNVYGPRQSLDNPYTGVAAIFSSRIKNRNPPLIYEDGEQTRDFVYVKDIVQANMLATEKDVSNEVYNVGTGDRITIRNLAEKLIELHGADLEPEIADEFRAGDIRHCFADISKIKEDLGYEPEYTLEEGMKELFKWAKQQEAEDNFDQVQEELEEEGLVD
ncbi:MAG: SDR family NAD(P)-dependent oxidoreductase [Candidatus Nanohalobium sp.]